MGIRSADEAWNSHFMKVNSFRILSFRSIEDSNWHDFSPDNVSVLVGQNESGKSSILEALSFIASYAAAPKAGDIRSDEGLPAVYIRAITTKDEVDEMLEKRSEAFVALAKAAFKRVGYKFELETKFNKVGAKYQPKFELIEPAILPGMTAALKDSVSEAEREHRVVLETEYAHFVDSLMRYIPYFSLFKEEISSLPDHINLEGEPLFEGQPGKIGAENFLAASGLDVANIFGADDRRRATIIRRANASINDELGKYWNQYLGNKKRISIETEFGRYPPDHAEKPGIPYLSFWVSEGEERFYPSQRSRGTRWFVSVFLHLLATEMAGYPSVVMLDEPGSFLHATAQDDVKKLIERIADRWPVIYSTHTPELVDFSKPYRILAVERAGDTDLADTQLFQAMRLACASRETLSPILQKMGADMRHQTVIKKDGNVILEEPSAHFYLKAFEKMLYKNKTGLSYIAASGVNNVPMLFALLSAWGLKFSVVLDDDKQGREVRKELIRNYFGDNADNAVSVLYKLKDCDGVEDCFTSVDFFNVVLQGQYKSQDGKSNSAYAKDHKVQKAVVAYTFFMRVEKEEIGPSDLSQSTLDFFKNLIDQLVETSIN